MTAAPTITTERLTLRAHRLEDFQPFADFYATEASRFVGGPLPSNRAWHIFGSDVGAWDLVGSGGLGIEETATGACVGQIALNRTPIFPEPEIGWIVFGGFEGRGYATEAARAVRVYAFGTLGWDTAVSYVDPENHASAAVARRLGCTHDAAAQQLHPGDLVFRHPAPEVTQ